MKMYIPPRGISFADAVERVCAELCHAVPSTLKDQQRAAELHRHLSLREERRRGLPLLASDSPERAALAAELLGLENKPQEYAAVVFRSRRWLRDCAFNGAPPTYFLSDGREPQIVNGAQWGAERFYSQASSFDGKAYWRPPGSGGPFATEGAVFFQRADIDRLISLARSRAEPMMQPCADWSGEALANDTPLRASESEANGDELRRVLIPLGERWISENPSRVLYWIDLRDFLVANGQNGFAPPRGRRDTFEQLQSALKTKHRHCQFNDGGRKKKETPGGAE